MITTREQPNIRKKIIKLKNNANTNSYVNFSCPTLDDLPKAIKRNQTIAVINQTSQ